MDNNKEIINMRNHFSSILEDMGGVLILMAGILISGGKDSLELAMVLFKSGNIIQGLIAMGGVIFLLLLVFAWHINRWWKTTITVKDGTFITERRTLNRKINTIAVQNISNINLEQNLFEMVMGTYKLKIDTNSMSTADETDIKVILSKKNAYAVKNLVMEMMKEIARANHHENVENEELSQTQFDVDSMEDMEENNYDVIYNMKEIVMSCIAGTSVLLVVCAIGFFISTVVSFVAMVHKHAALMAIFSGVLLQGTMAFTCLTSLAKNWLDDFNFRAKREKDKIYVSCGLIKRRKYAVPVDKINAVCITSTFVGRLMKRAYVKVINVGGEGEDVDGMKILLCEREEELKKKMAVLFPEFVFPDRDKIQKQPKTAFIKSRITFTIFYLIFTVCVLIGIHYVGTIYTVNLKVREIVVAGLLVFYVWMFFCAYLSYKITGLSVKEEYFVVSTGTFVRTIECIPYEKIQYIHYSQGPLDQKMGLKHGSVSILASTLSRDHIMGSFYNEQFEGLEEHIRRTYGN